MDSLGRTRTGNESETERRIKTEFLKQMDKIRTMPESVSVFATTNMPWELDIAALRRFERKILVPMPNVDVRKKIMQLHSGMHHDLTETDFEYLAKHTEGHSGSDLSTLVNDGLMRPIKEIQDATHFRKVAKKELIEQGLLTDDEEENESSDDDTSEIPKDLVWVPVCSDPSSEEYDPSIFKTKA